MNSEERREARRKRREEKRRLKREQRASACTLSDVADLNALYKAQRRAARGVSWKSSTQRYQAHWLLNINRSHNALMAGDEICRGFNEFVLCERGKLRHISSVHFDERVVHKSLTQNALIPSIAPGLIRNNTANIEGRGTSDAIRRVKAAMARHYRRHGAEGYVLQIDFRSYFSSIPHEGVFALIDKAMRDEELKALAKHLVEVQGEVGLGLGSEPNQIYAVAFPDRLDHFVTECCGVEAYVRYMDDLVVIHHDKAELQCVLAVMRDMCGRLGLATNDKKTRIAKLSRGFTFLKKKFGYSETGRVVVRQCRDSITRQRRKLKRQARLVEAGEMTLAQMEQSYQSWRSSLKGLDAHGTGSSMDALYASLVERLARQGDPPPQP